MPISPGNIKYLMRNQKQTEILQKHIKATIYIETTQILISDSYLKKVERDRTAGNPGRHRGGVHNLTGRKLVNATVNENFASGIKVHLTSSNQTYSSSPQDREHTIPMTTSSTCSFSWGEIIVSSPFHSKLYLAHLLATHHYIVTR